MLERLLSHPIAVILGAFVIAIGGLAGLRDLPVDLFPRLDYPLINVITHYPAGGAEDMEQLITRPLENAMQGLTHLRRLRSTSAPGFSQITVEFIGNVNALQARQLVAGRVATVVLPDGARPVLENIGSSLAMLSTYTLSGGDPVALRSWAQYQLAPRLSALPGIARIRVMGGGVAAWRIDVQPVSLLRHHLSMRRIANAVRAANVLDTGGYVDRHGRELLIRGDARLLTLQDLQQVRVGQGADGRPLRLADVARVYAGARPQRYVVTNKRLPAVAFSVQKQPGASTLTVSHEVDRVLAKLTLPTSAQLEKFYDQAEIIGLAYRNMRNNLLLGALLAIAAVLWILGRNRTSAVIAISFPLTVFGTFWVMSGLGLGLNLMTLGALTVAIGMVADDAIIVLENIDRHRCAGQPPRQAALLGTREIIGADLSGTLTVLAAFAPLILVHGLAGRFLHAFGISFSVLLAFSLLLSITLIPLAAARWMQVSGTLPVDHARPGARLVRGFERFNLHLLNGLLRHPIKTLLASVLTLLLSLGLLAFNPTRALPLLDEDSLLLGYALAPGTSLTESNRVGDALEQRLLALPAVKSVFRRSGSPGTSLYIEGPNQGELVVRLDRQKASHPQRTKASIESLLAAMPGVIGRVNDPTTEKLDESFSGLPALFGITLYGNDLKPLFAAAARVETAARRVPGISEVVNNSKVPVDTVRVAIDGGALARFGVDAATVTQALHRAVQGETLGQVIIAQQPIDVFLRYAAPQRDHLENLPRIRVPGPSGQLIPLSQLARIETLPDYPAIEHQRGLRTLTLQAEIDGNPFTVIPRLDRALTDLHLPADISFAFTGEYGQLLKTATQLLGVLLISALLVYGVIALQLGNWIDPLVVLAKLPLDFMGAALALFITRQALDLTVAIGFITLVGVATNNGIMLLTFTAKLRRQGLGAVDAVREAVRLRARPMLLTQLTTLLALIPAALGLGAGPQLLQALGIMLFGGLTAGGLLTLNVLPVLYVVTERWRRTIGAA